MTRDHLTSAFLKSSVFMSMTETWFSSSVNGRPSQTKKLGGLASVDGP